MYGKDFLNAIHTTVQMKMYLVDTSVDPVSEFKRMGVPNSKWRITHINDDYRLCSTYPSILSVPHGISDETIGYTFTTVTLSDPSFIMSMNVCMSSSVSRIFRLSLERSVSHAVLVEF